jgi:soluble lytic murein transglycosylase-like protein
MLKTLIFIFVPFLFITNVFAMSGKLVLANGHSITGDIRKLSDGGYWLTNKSGSVKYEKNEVKKVTIYSTKDTVSEDFMSSMRITPGAIHSTSANNRTNSYDNLISREAARNNIDPALVKAVIRAESNYNKRDVSSKGACGLMQLMPETARLLGVKSIFSPEENIVAGTRFLSNMIDTFDGNIEMGIAAYNAGPGAVKHYKRIPPFKETENYVKNIFKYYRTYQDFGKINCYTDEKGCLNISNTK